MDIAQKPVASLWADYVERKVSDRVDSLGFLEIRGAFIAGIWHALGTLRDNAPQTDEAQALIKRMQDECLDFVFSPPG